MNKNVLLTINLAMPVLMVRLEWVAPAQVVQALVTFLVMFSVIFLAVPGAVVAVSRFFVVPI